MRPYSRWSPSASRSAPCGTDSLRWRLRASLLSFGMFANYMLLLELPRTNYQDALEIQNRIVERKISKGGPDVLILLEHPPTVTLGVRGKACHLLISPEGLKRRGVALYHVDRGGEATYHGPGQLVGYPIVDLRSLRISVREYVHRLEETVIRTLALFHVTGSRQPRRPGVWTGPQNKIASIGVRIRGRITSHGFSLNVDVSLDPGELIVSCGMPDARMVDLKQVTRIPVSVESVRGAVARSFQEVFGVVLEPCSVEKAGFA